MLGWVMAGVCVYHSSERLLNSWDIKGFQLPPLTGTGRPQPKGIGSQRRTSSLFCGFEDMSEQYIMETVKRHDSRRLASSLTIW